MRPRLERIVGSHVGVVGDIDFLRLFAMRKRAPFRDGAFPPAPPLLFSVVVALLLPFASVPTGWSHEGWPPSARHASLPITSLPPAGMGHRPSRSAFANAVR